MNYRSTNMLLVGLLSTLLIGQYLYSQDFKDSRKQIDSLKLMLRMTSSNIDEVKLYHKLSVYYNDLQSDSARYFSQKILSTISTEAKDTMLFYAYDQLGRYYRLQEEYKKQFDIELKKLKISQIINNQKFIFNAYADLGLTSTYLGELDSAMVFLDKAEHIIDEVKDKNVLGDYYIRKGIFSNINGDTESALKYYLEAASVLKGINSKSLMTVYCNIGYMYSESVQDEKAIESFNKSLKIARKISHTKYICLNLVNIALAYENLGDHKNGEYYLLEALPFAKTLKNDRILGNIYIALASNYISEGKERLASKYAVLGLFTIKNTNDYNGYVQAILNLGTLQLEKGNIGRAKELYEKGIKVAIENKLPTELSNLYMAMSKLNEGEGEYELALNNHKNFKTISDSLIKVANTDKVLQLQMQYETLEKEKEIVALNAKNESNELRLNQRRFQNYVLVGALLFLILGVSAIYRQSNTRKKLNRELVFKNKEVEYANQALANKSNDLQKALKNRETLIKEIHHRIKNNLQLILSMLNLQTGEYDDQRINDFLKQSVSRVSSMALVHQILYSDEVSEIVDFDKYVRKLVISIYESFIMDTKKVIVTEVCAKNCFFPMDFAISLGIIVNELVYNSFKYAFEGRNSGKLKVLVKNNVKEKLRIIVEDDGKGIAHQKDTHKKENSYGLKIIELLVKQLKGEMKIGSGNGTQVIIDFRHFKNTPYVESKEDSYS